MIRRKADGINETKKLFGGEGEARLRQILNGPDEMYGKGRVFSHLRLEKGCEVGWHIHRGDGETYYILRGKGEFNDNGTVVQVLPGDVTFTGDGEGHALKNVGDETLEAIALILYK